MPRTLKDLVFVETLDRGAVDGQYPTAEGKDLLQHMILLRLASTPGEFTYRPAYGAGVERFVGYATTPGLLTNLAEACRRAALAEPEVASARVQVKPPTRTDPHTTVVQMEITRKGSPTPELLAFDLDLSTGM